MIRQQTMDAETTPQEPVPIPAADVEPPAASPPASRRRGRWFAQRATELCTVFVGVYAAFMLNAYQTHRQETQRRAQLLNWLSGIYTEKLADCQSEKADMQHHADEFERQTKADEMPALHAFNWRTGYNPADIAGLLQSGGYDLLDIGTIRAIKEEDGTLRAMIMLLQHDQQLSDALILPNLGKNQDVFYDPATKRLRESYEFYPDFYSAMLKSYPILQGEVAAVLDHLKQEQARNR